MQYQLFETDTSIPAWHYPLFWLKFTPWQALNCHSPSHLSVWFSTIQYYSKAYLNANENPIDNLLLDPLMNIDWKRGLVWSGTPSPRSNLGWDNSGRVGGRAKRTAIGMKSASNWGLMGSMVCPPCNRCSAHCSSPSLPSTQARKNLSMQNCTAFFIHVSPSSYVCICLQLVYLPTRTGCVLILMASPSPRLACNNEDSTFNNLDRQIKKRIQ